MRGSDTASRTMPEKQSNLSLYLAMLREEREHRKVRAWLWVSTHDQLANGPTKISADGTLPFSDLHSVMRNLRVKLRFPFRWNGVLHTP